MEQNNSKSKSFFLVIILLIVIAVLSLFSFAYRTQIKKFMGFATVTDAFLLRAIDQNWTTTGHAWGENIGWISFQEENGDIYVGDYALTGYAWGENIGWISLNCEQASDNTCSSVQYAVANDGAGNLSGYAWGENVGWIHFNPTNGGVTIDENGLFSGYAWGENIGWINFEDTGNVVTTWRHQSDRPQCNNGLDDNSNGVIDYPADTYCNSLTDDSERRVGGYSSGGGTAVTNEGGDVTDTTDISTTTATTTQNVNTATSTVTNPVSTSTPSSGPTGEKPTTLPGQSSESVVISFTNKFTRDLTVGDIGDDVNNLQVFLNSNGFALAETGFGSPGNETNYFGNRTKGALKKYQEANASLVLTPLGLTEGTGYFGNLTRSLINSLFSE